MAKERLLAGARTVGVWLEMLKPYKRCKCVLVESKLGVIVDDSPPPKRKDKALFAYIPKFKPNRKFCIQYEGVFTVNEVNNLIMSGHHRLTDPPVEKKRKKNKNQ